MTDTITDVATINLRVETNRDGWATTAARIEQALTDDPDVTWWSSAYGPYAVPHANTDNDSIDVLEAIRDQLVTSLRQAGDAVRHAEEILGRPYPTDTREWLQKLHLARGRQQGLAQAIETIDGLRQH